MVEDMDMEGGMERKDLREREIGGCVWKGDYSNKVELSILITEMKSSPVLCQETQKTHRTTEDQFSSLPRTRENGLGLTRKSRLTKPVFTPTGQNLSLPSSVRVVVAV